MATVAQSIRQAQRGIKKSVRGGVPTSVKNTQRKLRQDMGLTTRLPQLANPLGPVRGTGGAISALDFTDEDNLNGLL